MKIPVKELINGKYFWIPFLCFLVILKLVVENFGVSDQLAGSASTIKSVALIIFLIILAHFLLTLLIILVATIISGTYDKWIQKHAETSFAKMVDNFIKPAHISLALLIYGIYIYLSLSLSWSFFLLLIVLQIIKQVYNHFTEKKSGLPGPT